MGQEFVVGALALALSFFPLNPTQSQSAQLQNPQTKTVNEKPQTREVVVKKGDALSSIAEKSYGSKDYWTNVWNDNDWIKNPNLIEEGWRINVKTEKPEKPANLEEKLAKKLEKQRGLALALPASNILPISQNVTALPSSGIGPLNDAQISFLGSCESGMTATRNSGNGYFGAFQFSPGTWRSMGTGYERADLAPLEVQTEAVQRLVSRSNIYGQFPACSRRMQALGLL